MPKTLKLDRNNWLDNTRFNSFGEMRDKATNFVSNGFKLASQHLSSLHQKYGAIRFVASLALSTWLTSAIVETGINFLSNSVNPFELHCSNSSDSVFSLPNCEKLPPGPLFTWNWTVLSTEQFLANGLYGLVGLTKLLAPPVVLQTLCSYLKINDENNDPLFKFPYERFSARKLGTTIAVAYNLIPTLLTQKIFNLCAILWHVQAFDKLLNSTSSQKLGPFSKETSKTIKIGSLIFLYGLFFTGMLIPIHINFYKC